MEKFFEIHPSFASNDLFITGESYAGIYVPTLAEAIVFAVGNNTYKGAPLKGKSGCQHPSCCACAHLLHQGIAVGNGCAGNEIGVCGGERDKYETEFFLGTAMVAPELKVRMPRWHSLHPTLLA